MKASREYLKSVFEKVEPIGDIKSRAMFGGYGIFHRSLMFALIADDILYFKVDQSNRSDYEKAGSNKFPHGISYWEVPPEVFEDNNSILEWSQKSINIALSAASKKGRGKKL